jgi:hypothetical protein
MEETTAIILLELFVYFRHELLNSIKYELQHCNWQAEDIFLPSRQILFHKQPDTINALFFVRRRLLEILHCQAFEVFDVAGAADPMQWSMRMAREISFAPDTAGKEISE